jgi:hypothetical protein
MVLLGEKIESVNFFGEAAGTFKLYLAFQHEQ